MTAATHPLWGLPGARNAGLASSQVAASAYHVILVSIAALVLPLAPLALQELTLVPALARA